MNTDGVVHATFDYLYRDADNYKAHGSIRVSGYTPELDQRLKDTLDDGEYFVACQVDLDHPTVIGQSIGLWGSTPFPGSDADHGWCEYDGFSFNRRAHPDAIAMTELVARFEAVANDWDPTLELEEATGH